MDLKSNKSLNFGNLDYIRIIEIVLLSLTLIGFIGSIIFVINNFEFPKLINIVLILPFIFFLTPYLFLKLYSVKSIRSKMEIMPRFLRDVVDNVESGMDLISAINTTSANEYLSLNEDIKKLVNQLSWGIDFEIAFLNLAKNVGSDDLYRDFLLVVEARKVGGHVEKILRELSNKISVDILRSKERRSNLASNTFTGYISFLIFIFIIILIYNSLFVGIASNLGSTAGTNSNLDGKMSIYLSLLILLSYELAILSGFLFGLMQDNNIIAGAPHVVILLVMVFIGFFFFI